MQQQQKNPGKRTKDQDEQNSANIKNHTLLGFLVYIIYFKQKSDEKNYVMRKSLLIRKLVFRNKKKIGSLHNAHTLYNSLIYFHLIVSLRLISAGTH